MRRRPVIPALCAAVLVVVAQLVGFAHIAAERHVTCTEHGEELEAVELAEALHACEHDHLIAVDSDGGDHDDCTIARALRQSSAAAHGWIAPDATVVVTETLAVAPLEVTSARTLYLIAPKTSPPRPS